ncbi:MAG: Na(+)/H(+) antiporter subunit D [Nitrospirae bacterium]|nr:Na(+)/H(+) antiporter subunit D [Nitrospirota bacterium]
MTEWWLHPSILFIAGAFLIPFLKGKVQKAYLLLIPVVAFAMVVSITPGTYGVYKFLGYDLIFGKIDKLSLIFAYIFTIMSFIGMIYAIHVEDDGQHVAAWLYIGSSLGVIFAGDYFSLFVFWEIMAFASVYLVFARKRKESYNAGYRYILIHVFSGVCLLAGILLHYSDTGSFLFGPIHHDASLGFYMILIGFLINAGMPPLHTWLPDAYPEATITGSVFMSAFTTKVAVYVLLRAYSGTEILIIFGTIMAIYGVSFATLQNDFRKLLSYHIISQLGYMVVGIGLGTDLAMNGAAAHAINNILYKGILFMGAGAVIQMTGKHKLSDLGGLHKTMPVTLILYMIGGFSISAFPLFAGYISKSMILGAANHHHMPILVLLLLMVSAGTFVSTTLKIPYFMFFGKDKKIEAKEPPVNMLIAMGIAAILCIAIGSFPGLFYSVLPFPIEFEAYTGDHITSTLGILMFTALGFWVMLKKLTPHHVISLDTDWFLRKGTMVFMWVARKPIGVYELFITDVSNTGILPAIFKLSRVGLWIDRNVVDWIVNSVAAFILNLSAFVRRVQTGLVQHYAVGMAVGIVIIILIYSLIGG